jgi:hypothetical protein
MEQASDTRGRTEVQAFRPAWFLSSPPPPPPLPSWYLVPGFHEGVAIYPDVGVSPPVQVLGERIQAGDEAVEKALESIVSLLPRVLDHSLRGGRRAWGGEGGGRG